MDKIIFLSGQTIIYGNARLLGSTGIEKYYGEPFRVFWIFLFLEFNPKFFITIYSLFWVRINLRYFQANRSLEPIESSET